MYLDEDLIMISSLQHYLFCKRQCALIHTEQIWSDNVFTIQGELLHTRAHSETFENRPGKKSEFGIPIKSDTLGITGKLDAIEYHDDGQIIIIEYKRGKPKPVRADEVQLCAQALALEEMKQVQIEFGYIFYGQTRHRYKVIFDETLRTLTKTTIESVRALLLEQKTPPPEYKKNCKSCSLLEFCMPEKMSKKRLHVGSFLQKEIQKE